MSEKKVVSRSSISGRFVTQTYANNHKRTTETQHVKTPKK